MRSECKPVTVARSSPYDSSIMRSPAGIPFTLLVILWHAEGSTVVDNPETLNVVASLQPLSETLLGYKPPLNSWISPLSAKRLTFGPPRLFVSNNLVSPGVDIEDITSVSHTEMLSSTGKREDDDLRRQDIQEHQTLTADDAKKRKNLSSSFRRHQPIDVHYDHSAEVPAVRQIAAYSVPVSIPASGRALFSSLDVQDGSYHFGYDTGSGTHQSYREERRLPGGRVEGKYGYVDPAGVLRIVEYTADQRGYRSRVITHNLSGGRPPIIGPIPPPLISQARNDASAGR